jgi:hypothetical protein
MSLVLNDRKHDLSRGYPDLISPWSRDCFRHVTGVRVGSLVECQRLFIPHPNGLDSVSAYRNPGRVPSVVRVAAWQLSRLIG